MILADSSIWIDHLHRNDTGLGALLDLDEVSCHDLVVQEIALGSVKNRQVVLRDLDALSKEASLSHEELLVLIERHGLWGRGLSSVDIHLLGAVLLSEGRAKLWTRDKALHVIATELGIAYV